MCYRRQGPNKVSAFRGETVRKKLDANFYSPTPGLEVTRVLLAMALSKDLTILFGDIHVAFMNTPMPEGDPPHAGLFEHNDTVWCLKRTLNGLSDPSRLFPEHFAAVLNHDLVSHDQKHRQLFSWILRATCSLQCTSMI